MSSSFHSARPPLLAPPSPLRGGARRAKRTARLSYYHLITSSVDGFVRVWDVETGLTLREMGDHPKGALGLSLSPDGRFVAVGTADTVLRIWEVATGKEAKKVAVSQGLSIFFIGYAPDGKHVACGGGDGAVYLVDPATGTTRILGRCPKPLRALAWSTDARWIATSSEDPVLRLWDPATGSVTGFTLPEGGYWSIAFSPKGDLMAAGSYNWMLHLWELPRK